MHSSTPREEKKSAFFSPSALERWRGEGGSSFREREMRLSVSLSLSVSFFAVSLRRSRTKIKNTFFCRFQSGVLVGATFMSRQILHSPGFYASERKGNAASTSQSKRSECEAKCGTNIE